ncbi:hypothetical protein BHM03_00000967 [Ensete ventricosum]|nr:hypothetical protein BHM03_00000967 [Ensete ventricosum]
MFFCCSGSSTSGKWSGVMRDPRTMRSYGSRRTGEVLLQSVSGRTSSFPGYIHLQHLVIVVEAEQQFRLRNATELLD